MKTIEERAAWFADTFIESLTQGAAYRGYVLGATEQRAIDIENACEWLKLYCGMNESGLVQFCKAMEE